MEKLLFIAPLFIMVFLAGCEQDGVSVNDPDPFRQQADNYTIYTSEGMYQDLQQKRSDEVSEEFEIAEVTRIEEDGHFYLEIEIVHQACDPDPRIVWDGAVADSYPPQVYLFVQLLAGDECPDGATPEEKTEILSLDLLDLVNDEFTAEHAIFHVLNASNEQDSNDYSDEPDSSEEG